jgi:hypothetical protein
MKLAVLNSGDERIPDILDLSKFEIVHNLQNLSDNLDKKAVVFFAVHWEDAAYNVKRTIELARQALLVTSAQIHILFSELKMPEMSDLLTHLDRYRIHIHLSGNINFSLKKAKVYCWPDWLSQTAKVFRHYTPAGVKDQYTPYNKKVKLFDCLLGHGRVNRDFVYDGFINNGLSDKSIMTYFGRHSNVTDDLILEPHMVPITSIEHTMTKVRYFKEILMISAITPLSIYQKSAYSVITETNAYNHFSFFTEKTAKPILGRRLFIAFNGQYFLRNLRLLGFKTFDGIIDESYDAEPDDQKRWQMALEAAIWLSKQDQLEIFEKIKPITEHNFQVINTDWNQKLSDIIQST